jgi:hypothetical protein
LGRVAQERRDFEAAERWYKESLAIKEKHGNEHGAAGTYGQLGILERLQGRYEDAGRWLIKCIGTFLRTHDPEGARRNAANFLIVHRHASPPEQAKLKSLWESAGIGPFPDDADPGQSA